MKKFIIGLSIITLIAACKKEETVYNKDIASKNKNNPALVSWSDTSKTRIETWVKEVTDSASASFIPVADRIAVFDNDGTLWTEQPMYTQLFFAIDNVKTLSKSNPELLKDPILKAVANDDLEPLKKAGVAGLMKLINASHTNQTETQFNDAVNKWISTAKDKKFNKTYKELVFQPMIELLDYLRANNFKIFIVSGGGADFMRAFAEETYGIPPYQVIGSYDDSKFEIIDGKPVITKIASAPFVDDKTGKPVGIHRFIGKVPVFCAGNSDGDQAMLEYTSSSKYKSFGMIIHHTDSIREYAYDSKSPIGHLETALIEAKEKNWMVVDMKNDFKKIFSFQ